VNKWTIAGPIYVLAIHFSFLGFLPAGIFAFQQRISVTESPNGKNTFFGILLARLGELRPKFYWALSVKIPCRVVHHLS
jgi:hypothetical protein